MEKMGILEMLTRFLTIQFLLIASTISISFASEEVENKILYKYEGATLCDSKWGRIPEFQSALSDELVKCGKKGITADGIYGKGTHKALVELGNCSGYEDLQINSGSAVITTLLWQRLMPEASLPSTHERAFALALSHEGTDYDRVEWNYGTADDNSALTWGPYGATVGWGNEVRAILIRIAQTDSSLLSKVFASDYKAISSLIEAPINQGYRAIKPYFDNYGSRARLKQAFKKLGEKKIARTEYDAYAFDTNKWLSPNLRRLYSLIPDAQSNATEIDYAFFLDLGMHVSVKQSRIDKARSALSDEEKRLERELKPSERRRLIGDVFVNSIDQRWASDRLGRNVVFYIDDLGESNLRNKEIRAWKNRTRRRASQFGLSDSHLFYPKFL